MFHLGRFLLYLQTLYFPGKACRGQTFNLITKIRNLRRKKVLYHWLLGSQGSSSISMKMLEDILKGCYGRFMVRLVFQQGDNNFIVFLKKICNSIK